MKTLTLIAGLVQMAFCLCGCLAFGLYGSPLMAGAVVAAAVANGFLGTQNTLDACFGKGGLVCDLFARRVDATNE